MTFHPQIHSLPSSHFALYPRGLLLARFCVSSSQHLAFAWVQPMGGTTGKMEGGFLPSPLLLWQRFGKCCVTSLLQVSTRETTPGLQSRPGRGLPGPWALVKLPSPFILPAQGVAFCCLITASPFHTWLFIFHTPVSQFPVSLVLVGYQLTQKLNGEIGQSWRR